MVVSSWLQTAYVNVCTFGGTSINCQIKTKGIDISGGDYDFKSEPNLAGGRMTVPSPESDFEVTLDDIQFSTAEFDALIMATVSAGATYDSKYAARKLTRCVITFTPTAISTALDAITGEGYRMTFTDGYVTGFTKKFESDTGVLIGTLKMKFPIRNAAGTTGNVKTEYSATTLSVIAAYA